MYYSYDHALSESKGKLRNYHTKRVERQNVIMEYIYVYTEWNGRRAARGLHAKRLGKCRGNKETSRTSRNHPLFVTPNAGIVVREFWLAIFVSLQSTLNSRIYL